MDNLRNFYCVYLVRGDKLCDRFKDASVIRTIARHRVTFTKIFYAHHWKDTPMVGGSSRATHHHPLESDTPMVAPPPPPPIGARHSNGGSSRAEKNPTMTKI